jgi:endonuclease/exonuclease/phosphatase family metal-dependent hydrolase
MFYGSRMNWRHGLSGWRIALFWLLSLTVYVHGETFRIATYNLESYLETATSSRPAKSVESKAKIRESILALRPDVLALQEVGSLSALTELREALKSDGLELSHWELLSAPDTNIHTAVLSRFALGASRPHTNDSFLLNGRRFHVSRGFAEIDIRVNANYTFTLIAAHLKSRRAMPEADEAEMRLEEAKLLRGLIDARLTNEPNANLVVLGDFNDTKDSASTRTIVGRGKTKLVDTRPAERNGDDAQGPGPQLEHRAVTWTHYYAKEDTYRRIDFLLMSKAMAREWIPGETYVLSIANWGLASDHRPLVAGFEAQDK